MPTKTDFEKKLDEIVPEYPYEATQFLREAHDLFHKVNALDGAINIVKNLDDLAQISENLKPTNRKQALDLIEKVNQITENNLGRPGNADTMDIARKMYIEHNLDDGPDHAV